MLRRRLRALLNPFRSRRQNRPVKYTANGPFRKLFAELLEDRTVFSTYNWNPTVTLGNWDAAASWTSPDGGTTFPGATDIAVFGGAPAGAVTVNLDGAQSAATVTFSNTANSYLITTNGAGQSLTIGSSLTSSAGAALTNTIAAQVSAASLTGTITSGTLRLTNINSAAANSITGTFTVNGGVLEAFNTQTAGTDALGTANIVLNGGTFKPDAIPTFNASAGVFGRYYNFGFTPANNSGNPTVGQADFSQTPTVTRADTGGINFPTATPPTLLQPSPITATNFGVEWTGGLNILTGGSYTFTVLSDDGAQLFIDGTAVVTNNANTTQTSAAVLLSAGTHSVEMRFYQGAGGGGAVVSYNGPDTGGTAAVIPATAVATSSGLFQIATATANTFTNNVTVNAGATGTIDVTAASMDTTLGTLTTNAGSILNVVGSNTGRAVNFGGTTLGGNTTLGPSGLNLNPGVITGGGFTLTKSGTGTLTLSGANTAIASITSSSGTLTLSNANALGGGTLAGGPAATTINLTVAGVLGATGTINLTAGENLVAGVDSALNGLTVNVGAGATLQALTANALSGATINLTGGTLNLRADAAATFAGTINVANNNSTINVNRLTGSATGVLLSITNLSFAGGANTLNVTGGNTYALQLTNASTFVLGTNITINTVDANFTFQGAVSGAFKITKTGVNTLAFGADNPSWTGAAGNNTLDILQGTATIAAANGAGPAGSNVTLKGGTLGLRNDAATTFNPNVVVDPGTPQGTIDVNRVGTTATGITLSLAGSLTIAPGQTLNITGANTYRLQINPVVSLAAGFTTFNTPSADLLINGSGSPTVASLTGAGTLVKTGGNRLTVLNASTLTGGAILNAGALEIRSVTGLGTNAPVTLNGGTLDLRRDVAGTYSMNVTVNGNSTLNVDRAGANSGVTVSILSLTIGNNTLTKTSGNAFNLQVNGATTLTGNATLAVNTDALILGGVASDGGGSFGITKTAAGTLTLNAVNTYTGDTRVNAGTLSIAAAGSIKSSGVFVEPGGVLQLNAAANLAGTTPVVAVNSSPTALGELDIRYDGALPTVTAASTGVLALGSGTYSQAVNLATLGSGTFFVGASANTTLTGALTPSGTTYRLGGGGAQLAIGGTNVLADNGGATNVVVGTSLANGTINLTNGTGTVVLLNNNTYTGGTLVNRGSTVVVSTTADATSSPLGTGAVNVWGTLTAAGANGSLLANGSTTNNTNAVTLNPGSVLRLDNSNAFQGVAAANNTNRWGDTAAIALNGAMLEILGQNAGASTETVGAVTFDKGSTVSIKKTGTGGTAILTVASLARVANGTLSIQTSVAGTLSGADQLIDLNNAADLVSTNINIGDANADTMVQPFYVNATSGTVSAVTITAGGAGYTSAPTVTFSAAPAGGITATGIATISGGAVTGVTITNPGSGYTAAPTVTFTGGGFTTAATATSTITSDNSFVKYTATGFANIKFTTRAVTAVTAANNDVLNITAATALTADVAPYAMRVGNVAITGAFTVNLKSGGLILTGTATHASNFSYGPTNNLEALVYVPLNGGFVIHTGTDATSAGFTKFGQGGLGLRGNNTGLTGGFVNNASSNNGATVGGLSGTLDFNTTAATGAAINGNAITLNGGTLNLRQDSNLTLTGTLTVNADATVDVNRSSANSPVFTFNQMVLNNSTLSVTGGNSASLVFQNSVAANPAVILTGNATINPTTANVTFGGIVSDGGSAFGVTKVGTGTLTYNTPNNTNIASTYTGASNVLAGTLAFASTGTGVASTTSNFSVAPGAILTLNAATNVGGANTVAVSSNNLALGVLGIGFNAALPSITGASSGVLALNTTYSSALDLSTIGNGTFFLGSSAGGSYTAGTLGVGAGSTYRLGGGGNNTLTFTNLQISGSNNVVIGAGLANGTGTLTNGGGTVNFDKAQSYTGTTTLAGTTVTYLNNAGNINTNATTAQTQTLSGNVFLLGNSTINSGPDNQTFSSYMITFSGTLNYGGNSLQFRNGVVALTGGAATGTGATITNNGVVLHLTNMNQISSGNLQLTSGIFLLGKDDGTGVAPSWTQFMAKYSGGYGAGPNQWQITGNGGFGAKGAAATILIDNTPNAAYGTVTAQTVFDHDFRFGSERRGNLTGLQVYYADAPVIFAQNTTLSALRTISIANTGPGVSGAAGTGVVNRITGNLSGPGAPRFATINAAQGPSGQGVNEVSEIVLAGTNNWTGNPGTTQGINAGSGGLILDSSVFVRFANNASLPTGNNGAPAFLASIRDNQTDRAGGFLLTAGDTYQLAPGYSFVFGDTVPVSANAKVSILGSTSDNGTPGVATLQNSNVLILNTTPTGASAAPLPVDQGRSGAQTLDLLVRDGTLNLGSGANALTFLAGNNGYLGNNNFVNPSTDGVAHPLAFGFVDTQSSANLRTIEKIGTGTAIVNNVAYANPVAGTDASANFTWNIGNTTQTTFGGAVRETSETTVGVQNLGNVRVNFTGGVLEIAASSGSPNGDFIRGAGTGVGQVNWGTGGGGFATIGGSKTVNLGGNATPSTVSIGQPIFFGDPSTDGTVTFVNPITLTGDVAVRLIHGVGAGPEGTLSGAIGGAFNILYGQLGTLAPGSVVVSGASTYSGWTQINPGITVFAQSNGALGSPFNGTVVLPGAMLELQGGITTLDALALNGTGIGGAGALVNLSGNNTVAGLTTLGSATTINSSAAGATLTFNGGVVANFGLTVTGAGNTSINGPLSGATGFVPGLAETHLLGAFDTTTAAAGGIIQGTPRLAETNTGIVPSPWGLQETWVYTGQLFDADGTFALAENIDDNVRVQVDGTTRLQNASSNTITNTSSTTGITSGTSTTVANANTGTPTTTFGQGPAADGWHNVELRFGNAAGGAGMVNDTTVNHWGTGATVPKGFGYATAVPTSGGTNPAYDGNNYIIPTGGLAATDGNVRYLASNSLIKTGTGTLTLTSNLNSYSGGTTISGGAVVASVPGALGTGTVTLDGGTLTTGTAVPSDPTTVTGFGTDGTGWSLNGGATVATNIATLTDGVNSEARSVFFNTKVPTTSAFTASFTYTASGNRAADGMAFVLQNDTRGASALGAAGGSLGYGDDGITLNKITPSLAVGFDIFPNNTIGTNLFINGVVTTPYISSSPVNLASGNPINVTIAYNAVTQTLTVTLAEQNTTNVSAFGFSGVNLATIFGGSTAFVGFTGGTGGLNSIQQISNFSFAESLLTPTTYANSVAVTAGKTGVINVLAPNAPAINSVTMGTLTLGSGSTLTVGADAGTPANQAYSLTFGATTVATSATFNVANNGTGAGTLTLGGVSDGGTAATVAVNSAGAGTLVLAGSSTYTGATTVNGGTLLVDGSLTVSPVTVGTGATLGGTGTVTGAVTVNSGGTLAAGHSPGILNTGNLSLSSGSTLAVEIGGATPGTGAGFYDQVNVTGTVNLGGATLNLAAFGGYVPTADDQYIIVNNDGADPVVGTFNGLAEGALVSNDFLGSGRTARIRYTGGTGNDVVILIDHAPVVDTVTITPANPKTNDTLTANVTSHDADGDTVTFTYQWFKGGVAISGATGATLNLATAGNGDKNDQITVQVTPSDGLLSGAAFTSAAVTIQDSPPVIDTATITPASPKTNDTLTANVTSHDDDGDTVTFTYQWFKGGVAIGGATGATLNLATAGNGDRGDNITVQVTPSAAGATGTAVTSSAVTIVDSPPVIDTVTITPASPKTSDTLTANVTSHDDDADTVTFTYQWFKNGTAISGATTNTLNLATAGNGDRGDNISVHVTPSAAGATGTTASASVTVQDTAPVADTVSITPANPKTNDTLTANVTSHDDDGDTVTYTYQWFKGGVAIGGATGATLNLATAGNGDKNDQISVQVTPSDGTLSGTALTSAAVTVQDTAPVIDTVTITPSAPSSVDIVTANVTSHDDDGDTITYAYQWFKNGSPLAGATGATLDLSAPGNGDVGDSLTVRVTPTAAGATGTAVTSAAVVVQGGVPPVIDSVTISPANPKTNDTLTANVTSHDEDGDTVTYTYQWLKGGVAISGATGATLNLAIAGNGDKNDQISVRVTPFDGVHTGTAVTSATVTIQDTAPVVDTATITPASPKTNDTLTANVTSHDDDGDTVTFTYQWFKGGVAIGGATGATLNLATAGNGDRGDQISVRVTPSAAGATGTAVTSSAVTIVDSSPVVDTVTITPANPKTNDTLTANVTSHDDDGDTVTFTYQWFKGGVAIGGATGATLNLATAGNGDKGDQISVRVTPSAAGATGTAVTSAAVTIQDTAPVVDTVTITPANPKTNDTLTANVTSHDDDGDTVTFTYQWFKGGVAIGGATGATLNLATAGNGDKGDQISVRVTPSDGTLSGTAVTSAAVTVQDTAPVVDTVTITPASPKTNDTLTANVTSHDDDGDTVTYTYQWFNGGVAISGATGAALNLATAGNGDRGDQISVRVTPSAAGATGTAVTSSAVTVQDSLPVIDTVTISPSSAGTNDTLTANVTSHDDDGDTVTYTYQWFKGGVAISGATGPTLDLSVPGNGDQGDSITVRVTPTAAGATGSAVTSSAVVVGGVAPVIDTVAIAPTSPFTNDTLTANVTSHDDDGDTVTYTYQWFKGGVAISAANGATLNLSVPGNGDKGDQISVRVTPSDGTHSGIAVTSAEVTVQNSAPVIDTVSITPASPFSDNTLTANVTSHDDDGDTLTFTYQWFKNGAPITGATGATLDLSVAGNGDAGDQITVQVTPNDGTLSGNVVTSGAVTIEGSAPIIDSVTITPSSPKTNDTLTADVVSHDPDGDTVTYTYQWFKNGSVILGATGATLDLSLPGVGDDGDSFTVEVTPSDGTLTGNAVTSAAVVVQNSAPVIDSVMVSPTSPSTNDVLTATVTSHDDDGHPVTYSYQWFKNGVAIAGATGASLNLAVPGNGDGGDRLTVRVTATDGSLSSAPVTSSAVVVQGTQQPPPPTQTTPTPEAQQAANQLIQTLQGIGASVEARAVGDVNGHGVNDMVFAIKLRNKKLYIVTLSGIDGHIVGVFQPFKSALPTGAKVQLFTLNLVGDAAQEIVLFVSPRGPGVPRLSIFSGTGTRIL
jgi:autotransporter-associated beta strand protein